MIVACSREAGSTMVARSDGGGVKVDGGILDSNDSSFSRYNHLMSFVCCV
jgi:hypothetical protein